MNEIEEHMRNIAKHTKLILFTLILSMSNLLAVPVYASDDLSEEYVVVLDAGHDLEHGGAFGNGLREEEINLIITKYCKEALEKNENITVYLTHDTLECPYSGTIAKECNKKRCEYAANVNADLFISIHVNSSLDRYRRGFEIIYPSVNYKPEYNKAGEKLSYFIVEELEKTGLVFREIYTRDSTENKNIDENFFPDGTRADYYNVIRNSKYNDVLGIIIEHGYISNKNDAKHYLSREEDLKKLAEADARGIINYLVSIDENKKETDSGKNRLLKQIVTPKTFFSKKLEAFFDELAKEPMDF